MSERAAPFHCPYCGDEDLRPGEEGPGNWECGACNRAFRLKFLGLLARGFQDGGRQHHDRDGEEEGT
ncbi:MULTISPECIES: hypothetical protein [Streptomyces]|uniref:Insertion element protein n=1 Tax=Streptomyces chilikensis TaxID=1194079 RepID=A0ABV3ESP9_9ACTN|nr:MULTISPECIES: hypothetical protein [Streptomyces]MDH6224042.1 transposase-like protein [Streptomyces sp. MJP52]